MKSNRNRSQATKLGQKIRNQKTLGQPKAPSVRAEGGKPNQNGQRGWLVASPIWPREERSLGGARHERGGAWAKRGGLERKREGQSPSTGAQDRKEPTSEPQASALEMLLRLS